ncbi:MAG: CBS domain-containing protein [Nanoarchaeota archaeon]|nr:CBS domain-containing protein [Nanoarchaeota archaeon]
MKKRIQLTKFKQETGIKVGDMMTRNVIKVSPETTVKECVKKLFGVKASNFVVEDKGKLVGIITKRDLLLSIIRSKNPGNVKVKEVMTRKVRTIKPDIDLYQASILMKKTKIKKLPVMENNKIIGFLTMKDIVRFEPQLFEHIAEAVHIREESEKLKRLDKYKGQRDRGLHGTEGHCEECGNFGVLEEIDGRLICVVCKDNLGY